MKEISFTLFCRRLQNNFSAKRLKRAQSPVRLGSVYCSQCQVVSAWLLHQPFPQSSMQMSQEEAVKKTWCVRSWKQFQSLRKWDHKEDQEKSKPMYTTRVFHGTSIRVEIGYKRAFCKWRKGPRKCPQQTQDEGNNNIEISLELSNNSNHNESSYQVLHNFLI